MQEIGWIDPKGEYKAFWLAKIEKAVREAEIRTEVRVLRLEGYGQEYIADRLMADLGLIRDEAEEWLDEAREE